MFLNKYNQLTFFFISNSYDDYRTPGVAEPDDDVDNEQRHDVSSRHQHDDVGSGHPKYDIAVQFHTCRSSLERS